MHINTILLILPMAVLFSPFQLAQNKVESCKDSTLSATVQEVVISEVADPVPTTFHVCSASVSDFSEEEIVVLSKMLWGEARGVKSDTEKAAVIWCALNRVDAGYGNIIEVVTAPHQFTGYKSSNPVDPELRLIVEDVLNRWGCCGEGRVLPEDYLWFTGNGKHNIFRNEWKSGDVWDWSLESPYES